MSSRTDAWMVVVEGSGVGGGEGGNSMMAAMTTPVTTQQPGLSRMECPLPRPHHR